MTRKLALIALLAVAACGKSDPAPTGGDKTPSGGKVPVAKPADPVTILVAYGSEKKSWLEAEARLFEQSGAKTKSGRSVVVKGKAMGSGEAMQAILGGALEPHVFSPASAAYVALLNSAWQAKGNMKRLTPDGEPLVLSPIVIAMWKPMAEALGWPDAAIGWKELLAVNADPRGWGAHDHPEWGRFKLGHTHPEYSNSGLLAVLAEAYAGAGKLRGLTVADLDAKKTQDFIASVEETIVHYGKSTGFFAEKMLARGPAYLSAAVLYENVVIESYAKGGSQMPIVAIYPTEGTFWSDHPYAILDAAWVGAEEREAAEAFLAHLKSRPAQERALALGFRPADPAVPFAAPLDRAHGVDPAQPKTLLEVPDAATLEKLILVWKETKKPTDVIFVFDKSGSMNGEPLVQAKEGAKAFLELLHPRDEVTLLFFDNHVHPPTKPVTIAKGKAGLLERIDQTIASGGTALYDAIDAAYALGLKNAKAHPSRIHAVVVMTDGKDENSRLRLDVLKTRFSAENDPVKIFTITYGLQAEAGVLDQIAEAAGGTNARGTTTTIVQVYQDMASFF